MVKRLLMGIIGVGLAFEKLHYPAYQRLQDKYEIRAICDIDGYKLERWRHILGLSPGDIYEDFREMLTRQDLDAFDIMLPIELNFQVTEAVAQAGKPIICEKPLAPSKEEALAAKGIPTRLNVPVMIAENYRYNEENNIIRDSGGLGKSESSVLHPQQGGRFPADMVKDGFREQSGASTRVSGGVFYIPVSMMLRAEAHIWWVDMVQP